MNVHTVKNARISLRRPSRASERRNDAISRATTSASFAAPDASPTEIPAPRSSTVPASSTVVAPGGGVVFAGVALLRSLRERLSSASALFGAISAGRPGGARDVMDCRMSNYRLDRNSEARMR